jgi:hypothetical protein
MSATTQCPDGGSSATVSAQLPGQLAGVRAPPHGATCEKPPYLIFRGSRKGSSDLRDYRCIEVFASFESPSSPGTFLRMSKLLVKQRKNLIRRSPRSGRLEGRKALIQLQTDKFYTLSAPIGTAPAMARNKVGGRVQPAPMTATRTVAQEMGRHVDRRLGDVGAPQAVAVGSQVLAVKSLPLARF